MNNPTLWCVELVPKLQDSPEAELEQVQWLAKGIPADDIKALSWVAQVLHGIRDRRQPHFLRIRRRLAVFKDKRQAAATAKKEQNESWSAHVRPVQII